jgi:hypothetical protein
MALSGRCRPLFATEKFEFLLRNLDLRLTALFFLVFCHTLWGRAEWSHMVALHGGERDR